MLQRREKVETTTTRNERRDYSAASLSERLKNLKCRCDISIKALDFKGGVVGRKKRNEFLIKNKTIKTFIVIL